MITQVVKDEPSDSDEATRAAGEPVGDRVTAEVVSAVGPEGAPQVGANSAHSLRLMVVGLFLALVLIAVLAGIFVDVVVGVVIGAIGMLAIMFNPVFASAILRANDRQEANVIVDRAKAQRQ